MSTRTIYIPPRIAKNGVRIKVKKNESVAMGFWRGGIFHPIRASDDYDPEAAVGEKRQYAPAKRKAKKKRRS